MNELTQTKILKDDALYRLSEALDDLEDWAIINGDLCGAYIRNLKIESYFLKQKIDKLEEEYVQT